MEPILPRGFADPELQMAQALAMERATSQTDDVLRQYAARTDTFGGRYVCADTMKELMPGYAQSRESRNALNEAVHNASAVLSAEQFRRVVGQGPAPHSNVAVFITGIPGAGKSTAVETAVARNAAVVFEGQLSRPAPSFDKIDRALKAGFDVYIMAVHVPPEVALERTNARFTSPHNGRGASIAVMAEIQGNLPDGLNQIRQKFGDAVHLVVIDNTPKQERMIDGWQGGIAHLEKAGHRDEIKQRLQTALDAGYREGRYSADFYHQAAGRSPIAELGAARGAAGDRRIDTDAGRAGVSRGNSKENALTPYAQGKQGVSQMSSGPSSTKPAVVYVAAPVNPSADKHGRGR